MVRYFFEASFSLVNGCTQNRFPRCGLFDKPDSSATKRFLCALITEIQSRAPINTVGWYKSKLGQEKRTALPHCGTGSRKQHQQSTSLQMLFLETIFCIIQSHSQQNTVCAKFICNNFKQINHFFHPILNKQNHWFPKLELVHFEQRLKEHVGEASVVLLHCYRFLST